MQLNGIQIENTPNIIVITDSDANQITVTQPITRTVEVAALGPQGPKGDSVPFIQIGTTNTWYTTADIEITGSLTVSGSNTFRNIGTGIFSGSLIITGSARYNGNELLTTAITGGYVTTASFNAFSASYAVDSASFNTRILVNSSSITVLSGSFLTLSGSFLVASASFDSRINLLSASFQSFSSSYVNTSGSVSTRLSSLEQFSSSLDATFATDAQLNAATASLSSSIAALSSSYLVSSASFDTRINSVASGSAQLSGSLAGYTTTSSFNSFTSSYKADSASFDTRILNNSSSIALLSGSFLTTSSSFQSRITSNSASIALLSGSYLSDSSSFAQRITSTSGSLAILSGSFQSFSGSYNTGSFTGSFTGQGTFDNLNATTATITGNVTVLGTASINTLIVNQTQLSTGSNQLGDAANDTQTLFGTVRIPTGSLTVTGSSFFTGSLNLGTGTVLYGDTANSSLILDQTTGAYLKYGTTSEIGLLGSITRLRAANSIQLQTSTTTHLFVSSSGNVGIGTSTPSTRLAVGGNNIGPSTYSPLFTLDELGNNADTHFGLDWRAAGAAGYPWGSTSRISSLRQGSNSTFDLLLHTMFNGTLFERVRITGQGNVGINNSTPSASLHISGASSANLLRVDSPASSSILFVTGSGRVGIGTNNPVGTLQIVDAGIGATTSIQINSIFRVTGDGQTRWGAAMNQGLITWDTGRVMMGGLGSTNLDLTAGAATRARLDTSGNMGIGTALGTISARLHTIGAGATSATTTLLVQNANASSSLTITDDLNARFNGNVGVGTIPSASLHVSGSGIFTGTLVVTGSATIDTTLIDTVLTGSLSIGSTLVYSINTGSYNAGFFDYYVTSGSNGRAGTVMSFWTGSQIQYTDNSTPDVGDTSNFAFSMSLGGSNAQLFASASSNSWTVKTSFRTF